ncbi:hypothetical protein JOC77_003473 [Peribacillus deserti]|uniref:Uncharacterized protein n=1 Tax=Peribacillus deserti TaxID=673318 RepID=A0ABS2QLI0_9BACI|nr:hypothetical protein [Peribacillus deserti]
MLKGIGLGRTSEIIGLLAEMLWHFVKKKQQGWYFCCLRINAKASWMVIFYDS